MAARIAEPLLHARDAALEILNLLQGLGANMQDVVNPLEFLEVLVEPDHPILELRKQPSRLGLEHRCRPGDPASNALNQALGFCPDAVRGAAHLGEGLSGEGDDSLHHPGLRRGTALDHVFVRGLLGN